jgi:hypothetical protein
MQNNMLPLAICGMGRFVTRRILPTLSNDLNIKLTSVIGRSGLFDQALPDEVIKGEKSPLQALGLKNLNSL